VIIADLDSARLRRALAETGLGLHIGPFIVRLHSPIPSVAEGLARLYDRYPAEIPPVFADIHMSLFPAGGLRRFYRPQVIFSNDGYSPFKPLPLVQAFPFFEWSLNWCVATHAHQYAIIHAAVVARAGRVAILAGAPGAGKSTLCAALIQRGWRLFSDEMALVSLSTGEIMPLPRPVSLKNESIDLIRRFAPAAVFGPVSADTHKGSVAHVRAPDDSVARAAEPGRAAWLLLPRYEAGAALEARPLGRARMLMELAAQTFNYHILGETGFQVLAELVDASACYRLHYSRLEEAMDFFERLAQDCP